jgi:SRSO17 transposase
VAAGVSTTDGSTIPAARRSFRGLDTQRPIFQTKPEIAVAQVKAARAAGLPEGVALMDAGYGNDTGLRTEITALGLRSVAGIGPNTSVWPPGAGPLPPPQHRRGSGRPAKLLRRDGEHQPLSAKALALGLPAEAWQTITWREGSADWASSRFARRRVRPAHRDTKLSEPRAEEWLLIEWPPDEAEPKLRWRIERDYQELKHELGLGDYEGARVAWLSPSRDPLYRRLRLLDRRTRRPSPLRTDFRRALVGIWPSPR